MVHMPACSPADRILVHSSLLRNTGGAYKATSTSEETVCPRWPLTGMPLAGGSASKRPLYVKIDNNPHARPHYGITKADQVYEWLGEGLTTRPAGGVPSKDPKQNGSGPRAPTDPHPVLPPPTSAGLYFGRGP